MGVQSKQKSKRAEEGGVKVSNGVTRSGKTADSTKSGSAAERAAGRRRSQEGRQRSQDSRSSARSRTATKNGSTPKLPKMPKFPSLGKGLGEGLGKGLSGLRQKQSSKAGAPWWESQSENSTSQKAIMCVLLQFPKTVSLW